VTVIFGANGSGKSSLCEALQILASDDAPRRPHRNVHSSTTGTPSFTYRFASDSTPQRWSSPDPYGSRASVIKYFDTGIALSNVRKSVQPGRIVELAPFKLDVFEAAKNHCSSLRSHLLSKQSENQQKLVLVTERVRDKFRVFENSKLATLNSPTLAVVEAEIQLGANYVDDGSLEKKLKQKSELEKATSEDGLKLLKGEATAMKALVSQVEPFLNACEKLVEIDPAAQEVSLKAKEGELEVLAKALIPSGANLEKLMDLIRPADKICGFHQTDSKDCPLCKQGLGERELNIFRQYSSLLTGDLDAAIIKIRQQLESAKAHLATVSKSNPGEWSKDSLLPSALLEPIRKAGISAKAHFVPSLQIDQSSSQLSQALKGLVDGLSTAYKAKELLVLQAQRDRAGLLKQLETATNECQSLSYAKTIFAEKDLLNEVRGHLRAEGFLASELPQFSTFLRKITSAAKKAHQELVVGDFKARLNDEYLALAEKGMDAFGVKLKDVGGDATVTVDHHISGEKIEEVLSEGEQRVHALSLFFAELETCFQQVIVFDDPVSSFDYNYIGNYCNRLRDFALSHPNRQIIVFTHNWEFFVQVQSTLNVGGLNAHMAVNVLEGCTALDEYSEKIDDLKAAIDVVLANAGEPSKQEKEQMAGNMRRLLEAVVNTHVFNQQRHQFKQKNQQITAFNAFTKIVPLLPSEALTLRDLFSKLSISEHDDPRNAYVNTDKAMFLTRYNSIKTIEAAIVARK
jgi:energy-coupling factor transporter ATP-binding protein EcfA2